MPISFVQRKESAIDGIFKNLYLKQKNLGKKLQQLLRTKPLRQVKNKLK